MPLTDGLVERGYREVRQYVRQHFPTLRWVCWNLPGEQYSAIATLAWHLHCGLQLSRNRLTDVVNQDRIAEFRDDLGDAMQGRCVSARLAALADAQQRYSIPLQFLFEFIEGVDWLMRFPPPADWEGVLAAAARTGGSIMASAAHILGGRGDPATGAAFHLGQALIITSWLDSLAADQRAGIQRLADSDFRECEIDQARWQLLQMGKPVVWLGRLYGHRLEGLLRQSAPLAGELGFDGGRVVRALMAICSRAATSLRLHPERLLTMDGILPESDIRRLRMRYFLGLDMEVAVDLPDGHGDGHH